MTVERSFLTVLVPIYNEEANLRELQRRLHDVVDVLSFKAAEVLLIDDGSTDASESIITEIVSEDALFKGVFLTRNFGHQAAVSVGLELAKGSVVTVIDGDLQDPPEAIRLLLDALDQGADVAYGVRTRRKENLLKRTAYYTFYRLLRGVSSISIPLDTGDFCCMRREVVDAMLRLPERNRFLRGLRAWVGYRQVGVEYERSARFAGEPKYRLRDLVGLAYDGLFAFSNVPVRLMQVLGFVVSLSAIVTALGYLIWALCSTMQERAPGFATLIISIWFLAGVQLLFLGIVGEYVWRTCEEGRRRPVALVRQIVIHPDAEEPE